MRLILGVLLPASGVRSVALPAGSGDARIAELTVAEGGPRRGRTDRLILVFVGTLVVCALLAGRYCPR